MSIYKYGVIRAAEDILIGSIVCINENDELVRLDVTELGKPLRIVGAAFQDITKGKQTNLKEGSDFWWVHSIEE